MSIELTSTAFGVESQESSYESQKARTLDFSGSGLLALGSRLFNLPAQTRELEAGVPTTETLGSGAKQGTNDFGKIGYGGPAPPKGKPHRYFFKLYALDATLDLPPGATKAQLEAAMKGHILAEGQLMGTYQR